MQIVSTVPIVSLSLNAEASTPAHLVVSSLPPGSGQLDVAVDRALRKTAKGLCAPGSGLKARHRAQVDDEFTSEVDREWIRDRAPFQNTGAELQGVSGRSLRWRSSSNKMRPRAMGAARPGLYRRVQLRTLTKYTVS